MEFGKHEWRTFDQGISKEWLITNGIGGFASSTVIGANTRRYHGLLIASLNPPVGRHLILSNIYESIIAGNEICDLHSFQTPGFVMEGFRHLQKFRKDYLPEFVYNVHDLWINKKIGMVHGQNTVFVNYTILAGSEPFTFRLTPLLNHRNYHHTIKKDHMHFQKVFNNQKVTVKTGDIDIDIYINEGTFKALDNCYFVNMEYLREKERGLDSVEDHYIPGFFEVEIKPYETKYISIIASCDKRHVKSDGFVLMKHEESRLNALTDCLHKKDGFVKHLALAADQFIVYRKSTGSKTIIAGYPWFTDWGRDTMVSFTGLTLTTARYNDAREILLTFSEYVKDGLVPNMFPDEGQAPAYNSVDASLWYFEAVNQYLHHTKDHDFIREYIYDTLKDIVKAFTNGTLFDITMDKDGLIWAGNKDTQLTWMDAKTGDRVVTPRHGKAVEINALWYNALKVMENLAVKYNENPTFYKLLSEKTKISFNKEFWDENSGYLYDVINENKDSGLRPNQLLALSLSHPVVDDGNKAKSIIRHIWNKLYTPYGLRTLAAESGEYKGIYSGDPASRDAAYHQGTVWAWLLGPFIDSIVKVYGLKPDTLKKLELIFAPIKDHFFSDACIGSISEIFDGDNPHYPRGSIAQAWSVAEILRTYVQYMKRDL